MPTTHNWSRLVVRHKRTPRKMKSISPNRSENQSFALKRCAIASQNQIRVEDMNKRQKVQSGISTHLEPYFFLVQNRQLLFPPNITVHEDIMFEKTGATIPMITYNRKGKVKNYDHQLQDRPKEEKVASVADKRKCNSWVGDQPIGKMAFSVSGIICNSLIFNITLLNKINILCQSRMIIIGKHSTPSIHILLFLIYTKYMYWSDIRLDFRI